MGAVGWALNPEPPKPSGAVDGLGGIEPGEQTEESGGIDVEGIEPAEVSPPAPVGPSMTRLDYGSVLESGQVVDVYRETV